MAVFELADANGTWSEASSLDGRAAGTHYEASVRQQLWNFAGATAKAQLDKSRRQKLQETYNEAYKQSRKAVGNKVWRRIYGKFRNNERPMMEATVDLCGELQGTHTLTTKLGPAAYLLGGPTLSIL